MRKGNKFLHKHATECLDCKNEQSKSKTCPTCQVNIHRVSDFCVTCAQKNYKGANSHRWHGGRRKSKGGYIQIYAPEHPNNVQSYILEHRLVMEKHLNRVLLAHENVHHLNGVRDDNRLENLELWSVSQPSGQRVSDKLSWAEEIVALYSPERNLL
jgi:hypothetical protein